MKPRHVLTILAGILLVSLTSCTTTTTVAEYPDGRKVTTITKGIDPGAIPIAQAVAETAHAIHGDK